MKLNAMSWAALGAGLALFQGAQAAPIRVTIVSHQEWVGSMPSVAGPDGTVFRMGHAMSGDRMLMAPGTKKPGCHMKGERTSLGNAIRKAMGLPPVEHEPGRFAPMLVVAKPIEMTAHHTGEAELTRIPHMHTMHHTVMSSDEVSFLRRVHAALLTLGKWEARAVSFVLGCGIGVLLRMVWVFVVLIFRGVREEPANAADAEYTLVLAHVDEALPKYIDDAQEAAPTYTAEEKSETASGA